MSTSVSPSSSTASSTSSVSQSSTASSISSTTTMSSSRPTHSPSTSTTTLIPSSTASASPAGGFAQLFSPSNQFFPATVTVVCLIGILLIIMIIAAAQYFTRRRLRNKMHADNERDDLSRTPAEFDEEAADVSELSPLQHHQRNLSNTWGSRPSSVWRPATFYDPEPIPKLPDHILSPESVALVEDPQEELVTEDSSARRESEGFCDGLHEDPSAQAYLTMLQEAKKTPPPELLSNPHDENGKGWMQVE